MIRERKEEYEIVLADFDMPEMEALAFMREIEENHMPIVSKLTHVHLLLFILNEKRFLI